MNTISSRTNNAMNKAISTMIIEIRAGKAKKKVISDMVSNEDVNLNKATINYESPGATTTIESLGATTTVELAGATIVKSPGATTVESPDRNVL
ncbi:1279_t:CDS:2, partial [Racocetra fulgida]